MWVQRVVDYDHLHCVDNPAADKFPVDNHFADSGSADVSLQLQQEELVGSTWGREPDIARETSVSVQNFQIGWSDCWNLQTPVAAYQTAENYAENNVYEMDEGWAGNVTSATVETVETVETVDHKSRGPDVIDLSSGGLETFLTIT